MPSYRARIERSMEDYPNSLASSAPKPTLSSVKETTTESILYTDSASCLSEMESYPIKQEAAKIAIDKRTSVDAQV